MLGCSGFMLRFNVNTLVFMFFVGMVLGVFSRSNFISTFFIIFFSCLFSLFSLFLSYTFRFLSFVFLCWALSVLLS